MSVISRGERAVILPDSPVDSVASLYSDLIREPRAMPGTSHNLRTSWVQRARQEASSESDF